MTMNTEQPLDLAHLKARQDKALVHLNNMSAFRGVFSKQEVDEFREYVQDLESRNAQLCLELESTREQQIIDIGTIQLLKTTLSKAEGERDRMRDGLTALMEVWASPIIRGRLEMLALRRGGVDGTDEERAWVSERVEKAEEALSLQPLPQTEGREVVKPTVTQEEYLLQLFTNWCECSPYGEQIPDKWPELMADFVKKHKGKDRDAMAELFAEGDPGEPFEKLLESIFVTSCQFVLTDLSQAVDDGDTTKLAIIGLPAPVSEKGPVDSPEGLRPHIEK
jgi:hypothetical protein